MKYHYQLKKTAVCGVRSSFEKDSVWYIISLFGFVFCFPFPFIPSYAKIWYRGDCGLLISLCSQFCIPPVLRQWGTHFLFYFGCFMFMVNIYIQMLRPYGSWKSEGEKSCWDFLSDSKPYFLRLVYISYTSASPMLLSNANDPIEKQLREHSLSAK